MLRYDTAQSRGEKRGMSGEYVIVTKRQVNIQLKCIEVFSVRCIERHSDEKSPVAADYERMLKPWREAHKARRAPARDASSARSFAFPKGDKMMHRTTPARLMPSKPQ